MFCKIIVTIINPRSVKLLENFLRKKKKLKWQIRGEFKKL